MDEKFALFARMKAKPGQEEAVEEFLRSALPMVEEEPNTHAWYALKLSDNEYGIFDTFADEAGREAHLGGKVAEALMAKTPDLFDGPPMIEKVKLLATKPRQT